MHPSLKGIFEEQIDFRFADGGRLKGTSSLARLSFFQSKSFVATARHIWLSTTGG